MLINNYLKLSVRASCALHDAEAIPQAPSGEKHPLLPHSFDATRAGEPRVFVTTWIFPFNQKSKQSMSRALAAAQEKRKRLRTKNYTLPQDACQLSCFAPGGPRGVPVVGEPIRTIHLVAA